MWPVAFALAWGFCVAVERGQDPSLAGRPVAIIRAGKVVEVSAELSDQGLGPGLRRANLLELCPEACLLSYLPERYAQGQRLLLDLLARHFPAVEPLETTQTFLDVAGLAPEVWHRAASEAWRELGFTVVFGLGPTKGLARAAGLELELVAKSGRPPVPGATRAVPGWPDPRDPAVSAYLESLPVGRLYPLPADVPARLERLGFHTVGEVRGLPFTELVRQFGLPTARRIAAAASVQGSGPVLAAWPPPSLAARRRFEGGLGDRESLETALRGMAEDFSREMAGKGLACGEVTMSLAGEAGCRREASRRLTRPGRSRTTLACVLVGLAERLLEGWPPEDPPSEMEVKAGRVLPLAGEQLDFDYLFGSAPLSPGSAPGGPAGHPSREAALNAEQAREATRQLAWRFGDRVVQGNDGAGDDLPASLSRRARRESLLVFYDPLRAGGPSRV